MKNFIRMSLLLALTVLMAVQVFAVPALDPKFGKGPSRNEMQILPIPGYTGKFKANGAPESQTKTSSSSKMQAMSVVTNPNQKVLIILIQGNNSGNGYDRVTANTPAFYNSLVFGATNSVANYYDEVSYHQMAVSGQVAGDANGPKWYTSSKTMPWYGADIDPSTKQVDDLNGNINVLAIEALNLVDADFDFSVYDTNHDGHITPDELHIIIVHAGNDEAGTGITTDIWSHRGNTGAWMMHDGVGVAYYTMLSETSPLGTFCHEFGHDLGLMDTYDTTYYSKGTGDWDLMGHGNWLGLVNQGDNPAHLCAWNKMYLGWLNPTVISGDANNVSIPEVETTPVVYKVMAKDTATTGEYFLIENRSKTSGIYDRALDGQGLAVWHIDERIGQLIDGGTGYTAWQENMINSLLYYGYPYMIGLEQADGLYHLENGIEYGDVSDPFYSPNNVNFSACTVPNSYSNNYLGILNNFALTGISGIGTMMTANIRVTPLVAITSHTNNQAVCGPITVAGTVDDNTISSATLYVNGIPQAVPLTAGGCSATFSVSGIALINGNNTLEVKAADALVNIGTSGVINVNNTCGGTMTFTPTSTPTSTRTLTGTPTFTSTRTMTSTFSYTPTRTNTITQTGTRTRTATISPTRTRTGTVTRTATRTRTASPTYSRTRTATASRTGTRTRTATITPTWSRSATAKPTGTKTRTATITVTWSRSATASQTYTYTKTASSTITSTVTQTFTVTCTWSISPTQTATPITCSMSWQALGQRGFSAGTAEYTSLSVYNGTAYIAFKDSANAGKATVMKNNGSGWTALGSPGFTTGDAGYSISLCTSGGVPYVAFQDSINSYGATVMKYNGTNWVTVGSANFTNGPANNIVITIYNGTPYVEYAESNGLTVKKFDGINWVTVGAPDFSAYAAGRNSIYVYNGTPYVAYNDQAYSGRGTVMMFNGSSWVTVGSHGFTPGGVGDVTSIFVNNGTPYLAFQDDANGDRMSVMMFDGANWVNVGNPGFTDGAVSGTNLSIYNGTPYVACADSAHSYGAVVKKYDGSSWVDVGTPGFSTGGAWSMSLYIDGGMLYTGFEDEVSSNKASVMKFDCTLPTPTVTMTPTACSMSWQNVGSPGLSAGQAEYISLATYNGIAYIAYKDGANSGKATVMQYAGGNWVAVGNPGFTPGDAGYSISLCISGGAPYVAFQDLTNSYGATVMKYDGTNWVTVGAANFTNGEAHDIVMTMYNGTPYVVYAEYDDGSNRLTVKKFVGINWVTVGAPEFSVGTAGRNSIYVYNGTPYVAYNDQAYSGRGTVMMFDGSNWVNVGSPGFTPGGVGDVTSIFVNNGTPYLAFQDGANGDRMSVMMFDGSNWVNVGNPGFTDGAVSGTNLSIYNGTPYVAYADSAHSYGAVVKKYDGLSWVDVGTPGFSAGQAWFTSMSINSGTPYVGYEDSANSNKATVMKFDCGTQMLGALALSKTTPTPVVKFITLDKKETYMYPNPASNSMTIRFPLSSPEEVKVVISDLNGKPVWHAVLDSGSVKVGVNSLEWNAVNDNGLRVANGVYLVTVSAGCKSVTKKAAIVK